MRTLLLISALGAGLLIAEVLHLQSQVNDLSSAQFGVALTQTASSDTLNTLRTNVNTAFTNINAVLGATTTSNSWTLGTQTFASTTITNASTTNSDVLGYFKISTTGTGIQRLNHGICYFKAYATTIAASSTALVDCQATAAIGSITAAGSALTGVTNNDFVQVVLSTTTAVASPQNGIQLEGAAASSTTGYITLRINNLTGAIYTWPVTGPATGTAYYISSK